MTTPIDDPYLKYALFCRGTEEGDDGELSLKGIVDLVDLPEPPPAGEAGPVLAEVDVNLAFCIGGALPRRPSPVRDPQDSRRTAGNPSSSAYSVGRRHPLSTVDQDIQDTGAGCRRTLGRDPV